MNATLTRIADRIDRGITDHTDADALRAMLGKPAPMLQDCDRKLSAWLASTPHARQHAIEAAAAIAQPDNAPVAWQWLKSGTFRVNLPRTAERGAWRPLYADPAN